MGEERVGRTLAAGLFAASFALAACQTNSTVSVPRTGALASQNDAQSIRRQEAAYQSLVARGKAYHFTGHISDINVGSVNGTAHIVAHARRATTSTFHS